MTFTVTNTNSSHQVAGSLGAAIDAANANPGEDTIVFNIPGNGPFSIQFCAHNGCPGGADSLPFIRESVIIDATTQPGAKTRLLAMLFR